MTKDSLINKIMGELEAYVGHPDEEWNSMCSHKKGFIYDAINKVDNVVRSHIEGPYDYTKEG